MSIEYSPIIIDGARSSGTRLVAALMENAGVYMGECFNPAKDNLWFTLLFRHLSIDPQDQRFATHYLIFRKAIHNQPLLEGEQHIVESLSESVAAKFSEAKPIRLASDSTGSNVFALAGKSDLSVFRVTGLSAGTSVSQAKSQQLDYRQQCRVCFGYCSTATLDVSLCCQVRRDAKVCSQDVVA